MPELYKKVDGWLTYASLYDEMVEKYPNGAFAEIGCWFGQSAVYLLEKIKESNYSTIVTFVDTWLGGLGESEATLVQEKGVDHVFNAFIKNTESVGYDSYQIVREDSVKAADQFIDEYFDFIFIDAGHRDWQCYNDMISWYPKLKPGGTMAGHDIDFIDVEKSVDRFSSEYGIDIQRIGSPTQCWKFEK